MLYSLVDARYLAIVNTNLSVDLARFNKRCPARRLQPQAGQDLLCFPDV